MKPTLPLLLTLLGTVAGVQAAEPLPTTSASNAEPTLRETLLQTASGTSAVFEATLEQLELPGTANRTAFDVVLDANLRARIESRIAEPAVRDRILGADSVSALIDILQTLVTSDGANLSQKGLAKIRLRMAKGTYVDVSLDPASTIASVLPRTARTEGGQLIPTALADINGDWAAETQSDLGMIASHMQRLGATITRQRSDEPGLSCLAAVCTLSSP